MDQCEACGQVAPTKYVSFHQNIGLLIIRFGKSIQGHLCKACISKFFWEFTLITFFAGWWGIISFFVTIFALINNLVYGIGAIGLPGRYEDEH